MKKVVFFLSLFMVMFMTGCSDSKDNNNYVEETKMTLVIGPKLITEGFGSSQKLYYDAQINGSTQSFKIPYGDILKFDYKEGFKYTIAVTRSQQITGGVPVGNPLYVLEKIVSQEQVGNQEDPQPDDPEK